MSNYIAKDDKRNTEMCHESRGFHVKFTPFFFPLHLFPFEEKAAKTPPWDPLTICSGPAHSPLSFDISEGSSHSHVGFLAHSFSFSFVVNTLKHCNLLTLYRGIILMRYKLLLFSFDVLR